MLAYILALSVGFFSLYLLATAFITPNIHRKDDFLWSAVGLFYALVLWLCAGQFKGAVLLGQGAAVILLLAIGVQNLNLRRVILAPDKQQALLGFSVIDWLQGNLGKVVSSKPKKAAIPVKPPEKSAPRPKAQEVPAPPAVAEKLEEAAVVAVSAVEDELDNWGESELEEEIESPAYQAPAVTVSEIEESDNWGESETTEEIESPAYETPAVTVSEIEESDNWGESEITEEIESPAYESPAVTVSELPAVGDSISSETREDEGRTEILDLGGDNGVGEVIETITVRIESSPEATDEEIEQEIIEAVEAAAEIGTIESVEITTSETIIINLETSPENDRHGS